LQRIRNKDPEVNQILDVRQNGKLAERPQLIYALAAALALRIGQWPEAERFAELAMPAESVPRTSPARSYLDAVVQAPADESEEFEFLYLTAVSKRFRMGSRSPQRWHAREDIWLRYLNSAVKILDRCERHHAECGELVREARAISERAAARLFYAGWAAVTEPDVLLRCNFDTFTAVREFRLGLDDLRKCQGLEAAARAVSRSDTDRSLFFQRVEKQYIVNLAAAHVLSLLLTSRCGPVRGLLPDECERLAARLQPAITSDSGLPTAALTDIYAFFALERKDEGASKRLLESAQFQAKLPLDRSVLDAVRQKVRTLTGFSERPSSQAEIG